MYPRSFHTAPAEVVGPAGKSTGRRHRGFTAVQTASATLRHGEEQANKTEENDARGGSATGVKRCTEQRSLATAFILPPS
ncbi:hypothetical protein HOE425_320262 [Hoeflea sp. EC-HK425]|nr:hypothetical protein HOE425_320262 [Hoeflea sp. EC-HK425]